MSDPPAQQSHWSAGPTTPGSLAVDADNFFSLSDARVLVLIRDGFPDELGRLTRAYSIRDHGVRDRPSTPSPSRLLFQADYDEVNRTLVGLLALRWIVQNQYTVFTGSQPASVRLTRSSFDWLRARVADALQDNDNGDDSSRSSNLHALVTSVVINDLGKDPQLATDYQHQVGGADISFLNHDAILLRAAEAGMVPSLARLSPAQRTQVLYGLRLGADFNLGQLAQAESPPASLLTLTRVTGGDPHAFDLHFVEQLLDVSGAAGHMDWTCARKLIEPVVDAYRNAYDGVAGVLAGRLSLQAAYHVVLERRVALLTAQGFRRLTVDAPHDRVLMRLLCMGGVADLETAQLYDMVWQQQTAERGTDSSELVHALNVDGLGPEPAMQPTYMPALLVQALLGDGGRRTREQRAVALASALRFLARLMRAPPGGWPPGAAIVERNVLDVVKSVIQTSEFQANPAILDRIDLPKAVVAMWS